MREKETAVRSNSPASLLSRPNLQTIYVAASNELEQRIAEIWQKLLGLEPVGIFDNFFDLGGNSLLGTQLVAQLRSAFQVEFPLRNLFENPTVAGVAEIIEAATKERQGTVDKIAEALKKVEELSEEEAKALLDEMQVSK
jgi:acyl carrier protein